jgi:putative SOS response-associated peptidase YedK
LAKDDAWQPSCAILTRDAVGPAADVHDRMPVILSKDAEQAWLDPKIGDAAQAATIAREGSVTEIEHHPVSSRVNVAKSDDEELIKAVNDDE